MNEKLHIISAQDSTSGDATTFINKLIRNLPRDYQVELIEVPSFRFRNLDMLIESIEMINRRSPALQKCMERFKTTLDEITASTGIDADYSPDRSASFHVKWKKERYDVRDPVNNLVKHIIRETENMEENCQSKMTEFIDEKKKLETELKKYTTNTAALPMSHLLKEFQKQNVPTTTDFLKTLFVVVPTQSKDEWLNNYQTLSEPSSVVPNSSILVFSDTTNCIFSVTIFQKVTQAFKKACMKHKWSARDPGNEGALPEHSLDEMQNSVEILRGELVRLLHLSLNELRVANDHLKVIECYVESIMKYGPSANFVAFLIRYRAKDVESIRRTIITLMGIDYTKDIEVADEETCPFVTIEAE